jgi:hypothetical protein
VTFNEVSSELTNMSKVEAVRDVILLRFGATYQLT